MESIFGKFCGTNRNNLNPQEDFISQDRADNSSQNLNFCIDNDNKISINFVGDIWNIENLPNDFIYEKDNISKAITSGYREIGAKFFDKINGSFAIALIDHMDESLILACDKFGFETIFYEENNDEIIFSSKLRLITKNKKSINNIDIGAICNFLTYRYIPSPQTIFKDIFKLEAGSFLLKKGDKTAQIATYTKEIPQNKSVLKAEELQEKFEYLFENAIKKTLLGKSEASTLLSSGYDSTVIAKALHKLNIETKSFTLAYPNWENSEHFKAEKTAQILGTTHFNKIIKDDDFPLKHAVAQYPEPIADISILPTNQILSYASAHTNTIFSGEGADELLAAYNWYYDIFGNENFWNKFIANKRNDKIHTYINHMSMGLFDFQELNQLISEDYHKYIPHDSFWFFDKNLKTKAKVKDFQMLDIMGFMSQLVIKKMSYAAKANSIKLRTPFLEKELFEFLISLNPKSYFDGKSHKKVLENYLKNSCKHIIGQKKQGFVPYDSYYSKFDLYEKIISNSILVENGIFSKSYINQLIIKKETWKLWKIVTLELWLQENIY